MPCGAVGQHAAPQHSRLHLPRPRQDRCGFGRFGVPAVLDRYSYVQYYCTSTTVNFQVQDCENKGARKVKTACWWHGMSLTSPPCSSSRSTSTTRVLLGGSRPGTVSSTKLHRQARSGFYCPHRYCTAAIKGVGARKKLGTGSQGRRAAVPAELRKSGPQ